MMNMKRLFILQIIIALSAISAWGAHTVDDVPNVHVADRTQYVSNPDGVLGAAAVDSLNRLLGNVWASSTAEPVVGAIDDFTDDYDENTFATKLFEKWTIGKSDKDNGVLILLVRDRRRMVIRTGYGAEGVLPDIICGRIIRDVAIPHFRGNDYDGGMLAATKVVSEALTDPSAAAELRSKYANDARARAGMDELSGADLFSFMVRAGMVMAAVMLLWVLWVVISTRGDDPQERYRKLNNIKPVALFVTFIGLGMPVIAYLICAWKMRSIRNKKRKCPNCGGMMHKLDEVTDNEYLTPAQDMEERLNSIDYDVWLCDTCGEKDVIPYVNKQSSYTVCPQCGARTCALAGNRIIMQPTTMREGRGERIYSCRNCHRQTVKPYNIAKLAAPIVVVGGSGFGGGGGGFSGGSFGGGMTGGGGASGGW